MAKKISLYFGFLALIFSHAFLLFSVPGFHFDEAWAASFAHRITTEKGFWPLEAMSPYTIGWAHYFAALFFKMFGTSLLVYRLSGVALAVSGIALIAAALWRLKESKAAIVFLWIAAFSPVLVMNHRFVIEINTFQVFCFGLLAFGFAEGSVLLMVIASVLGVTSHLMFLAPALAVFALSILRDTKFSRGERSLIFSALSFLLLFFVTIYSAIPEKDKVLGLLVLDSFCAAVLLFRLKISKKALRWIWILAPFLVIPVFLLEGSWSVLFNRGYLPVVGLVGLTLIAPAVVVYDLAIQKFKSLKDPLVKLVLQFLILVTFTTVAVAVKVTPRYYEIPILVAVLFFSLLIARQKSRLRWLTTGTWVATGFAVLVFQYWLPGAYGNHRNRDFRFLFFKDSSRDTTPKQLWAKEWAEQGCSVQRARGDERLLLPLKFLSVGDWTLSTSHCSLRTLLGPEDSGQR